MTSFSVEATEGLTLRVSGPRGERTIDLTALNDLEGWRRQYDVFTLPRPLRLAARWLTAGQQWLKRAASDWQQPPYLENAGLV